MGVQVEPEYANFYNQEVEHYKIACEGLIKESFPKIDDFVSHYAKKLAGLRA